MNRLPRSLGVRAMLLALLLAGLAALLWGLPLLDWLTAMLGWVQANPFAGAVLYLLVFILGCVCMVPGSIMVMTGGFLFGLVKGAALVSVAVLLGATAALLVARGIGRAWVRQRLQAYPKFAALDLALQSRGLLVVMLTRMSLLLPYNLLNLAYGLTSVRLRDYMLGTWLGMLPAVVLYVYLGSLVRNAGQLLRGEVETGRGGQVLLVLGLVAAVAVVVIVHRTASRLLAERMPPV